MFTDGLDPNAVKWVREGSGIKRNVELQSSFNQRSRYDPAHTNRKGVGSFGLPPTKLRSVHLPHGDVEDSGFGSETEATSDSEEDVYGGRYSLDSSPQDEVQWYQKHNRGSALNIMPKGMDSRNTTNLRQQSNSDDNTYSDVSSSLETMARHCSRTNVHSSPAHPAERPGTRVARYENQQNEYTEDESSDSAGSSECTRTTDSKHRINNGKRYVVESYLSSSTLSQTDLEGTDKIPRGLQTGRQRDVDLPTAPPFCGLEKETNHAVDQSSTSRASAMPRTVAAERIPGTTQPIPEKGVGNGIGKFEKQESTLPNKTIRTGSVGADVGVSPLGTVPARVPTFHVSGQGPWQAIIAYDACVRLCLHSWARGCLEAPFFLENECSVLRNAFGLQQILLQSEEELLAKRSADIGPEVAAPKPKKTIGKMKVQVRRVKMVLDVTTGCSFSSMKPSAVNLQALRSRVSNLRSTFSAGWEALSKVRVLPRISANASFSRNSLAYMQASTQYIKQVSSLLKVGVTTLRSNSSYDLVQESYSCSLRLKSSTEDETVRMQPGSNEKHVFFPDSPGDDLIVEVWDSKGILHGRVLAQLATIIENPNDKLRWWSIYHEPEHELVGRLQLYINYTTTDENSSLKCGPVAETVAYDLVLEVAMKIQHFRQRNLLLNGSWKWLLLEFASYYGVSDAYCRLRYLSYVMDVATPTEDCLVLVHDLLLPVVKSRNENKLSRQEKRILGETEEQIEQILALLFENYKSLDESSTSGLLDVIRPPAGAPAPALVPAVKLYTLLHDILLPETQLAFCSHFQVATKKRSRRHMADTDEYVASNTEGTLTDVVALSTAYSKMKALCMNIRNEIFTDIEIHNQHVLPSFVDLPNISASIYSVELCSRLRAFLVACPPSGPSPYVTDLVIATADFQRDLSNWNISPIKGGVDAKELFHLYIVLWIEDKRHVLLETCKLDKVKWSGVKTQHLTTPFVDEMYDRLKETLNEYEIIICRWPEYTFVLENAIADVEKSLIEALEKQYADVLAPLKESLTPKKFGLKYVQKLAKRHSLSPYSVPEELAIFLNTIKRWLDVLQPKIEAQLKSWVACIPDGGSVSAGERLSEITVMLRSKFRNYLQAVVEKLCDNTRVQSATKLKKIIQDTKEAVGESEIRERMQPLKAQLVDTIDHLHGVFESHVFLAICRGYWDRMGQDVLSFLENRKENRSWYKASRVTVAILDDTFASQMQRLQGNAMQEKDLEPPRSVMEVRSILCKDAPNHKDSNYFYY
ncbi:uncharacterized protein LOC116259261 [Nymphaea colorata]|nr:uncharacterized protein LOC116259261 [Nymphaea colorata]